MSASSSTELPSNKITPETEVFIEVYHSVTKIHHGRDGRAKDSYNGVNFEWVTDHHIRFFDVHEQKPVEISSFFPIIVTPNKRPTA